jgi:hypothetical protein
MKGYASLGFNAEFIRGYLPSGNFSENVWELKLDLYLKPDLGIKTNLQYDNVSNQMGFNGKFFWQLRPGTILYLVYNNNWLRQWDPDYRITSQEQKLNIKLQLNIRL